MCQSRVIKLDLSDYILFHLTAPDSEPGYTSIFLQSYTKMKNQSIENDTKSHGP